MTATQVIAEIDKLPPQEMEAVIAHVHELEAAMIPESFEQSMAEAEDMEDVCAAREILATEKEWTPWEQVKSELHELRG